MRWRYHLLRCLDVVIAICGASFLSDCLLSSALFTEKPFWILQFVPCLFCHFLSGLESDKRMRCHCPDMLCQENGILDTRQTAYGTVG